MGPAKSEWLACDDRDVVRQLMHIRPPLRDTTRQCVGFHSKQAVSAQEWAVLLQV